MSGRWDVTLFYLFIVSFGCAIPGSKTEVRKLKDIYDGLLELQIKEEDRDIRGRVIYWTSVNT